MSSKQKHRKDTDLLLNLAGKLVTSNADKEDILSSFFASAFTGVARPQITRQNYSYENMCRLTSSRGSACLRALARAQRT